MSNLGNKEVMARNIRHYMQVTGKTRNEICQALGIKYTTFADWVNAKTYPRIDKIEMMAKYFGIMKADLVEDHDYTPNITDDTVTLQIIGEVAAGYDHYACEDWTGEKVDVPRAWLRGRAVTDFFALRVIGDSMYPLYMDGDIVVVRRQTTLNRSGEIGVIIYNDDIATLKKVEYNMGEDWMKLVPINPNFKPEMITGEELEHCCILGVPTMLIRDVEQTERH